ncbi:MAG: hypothetical protein R6V77_02980, partial [Candidatus Cloacimonadaceae bacterium]
AAFLTAASLNSVSTINPEEKAPEVLAVLTDSLDFYSPVILDIRCGEWTNALQRELRKILLQEQIDVRETDIMLLKDNNDWLPIAMESDFGVNGKMLLQMLNLDKAYILEMDLEQSVETGEKRNFISYSRYSMPVYRFVMKQISLPEQQLLSIQEYKLNGTPEVENPGSLLAMKWYEPILASAVLGSLIYMLWTLK